MYEYVLVNADSPVWNTSRCGILLARGSVLNRLVFAHGYLVNETGGKQLPENLQLQKGL